MDCVLCRERGKTWSGSDPVCAFKNGLPFHHDNWNCATLNKLRELMREYGYTHRDDMAAASIGLLSFEGDRYTGYIVMTWYKERGAVGNAVLMWDDMPMFKLTEEMAVDAINYWEVRLNKEGKRNVF